MKLNYLQNFKPAIYIFVMISILTKTLRADLLHRIVKER